MNIRLHLSIPSVACAVLLSACGGGSGGGNNNTPVIIADPEPDMAFFNDVAETSYVDTMIGRFVSILRPLSSISGDLLEKRAKRTIAATETLNETCSGGGSVALSLISNDVTAEPESASINFNNCTEEGETVNGAISFTANLDATGDNGTINFTANNFTVTGGEENIAMSGAVSVQMQSTAGSSTFSISGSNFSLTAGAESISISNYNISAVSNDANATSSLSATMTVSSTADGTVTFNIDPPLSGGDFDDYPTTGTVTMTHSDGSSLTMNAANGDPASFDFIINTGSSTSSGVQRWDETDFGDL